MDYLQKTSNKYLQSPKTSPNQSPLLQHKPLYPQSNNLYLYIINSNKEQKGTFLKLTPYGIENGIRGVQDGITYFGFEEKKGEHNIDYIIKPKEDNYDSRFIGKHFQIKFNTNDMKYYLKDLGHGFGTFIKVITWTRIINNMLINIGENYIVFTFGTDEELITQTGGIVQGMSGSPIIQNEKLVGAVTHVLINDPTRGYGIFIENMLEVS